MKVEEEVKADREKFEIVCDGTSQGTEVRLAKKRVRGIQYIKFEASIDSVPEITMRMKILDTIFE